MTSLDKMFGRSDEKRTTWGRPTPFEKRHGSCTLVACKVPISTSQVSSRRLQRVDEVHEHLELSVVVGGRKNKNNERNARGGLETSAGRCATAQPRLVSGLSAVALIPLRPPLPPPLHTTTQLSTSLVIQAAVYYCSRCLASQR